MSHCVVLNIVSQRIKFKDLKIHTHNVSMLSGEKTTKKDIKLYICIYSSLYMM